MQNLLAAHAGPQGAWHRLAWAFDARLAEVLRKAQEPLIAQMRLTWWHEALGDASGRKGKGEPLLDQLRTRPVMIPALQRMVEGWEELSEADMSEDGLRRFGEGRGGGLFGALAPDDANAGTEADMVAAGGLWALWDLSGHVSDARLSQSAVEVARAYLGRSERARLRGVPHVLRTLAARDIRAGRPAPSTLTPRLYARLLRVLLVGR